MNHCSKHQLYYFSFHGCDLCKDTQKGTKWRLDKLARYAQEREVAINTGNELPPDPFSTDTIKVEDIFQ